MTSTALVRPSLQLGALSDPAELGRLLAASGYFADATQAAQAVVKVLAGQELGFGPIASMTGVYIVKGRVTLSANLMAAQIKRHRPRCDYKVRDLTNDHCVIAFYEDGEEQGTSEFTMADAERAGLANGDNWRKYPRNMLFARAMSNGAKLYCPDAFAGAPIYTPDELGAEVDPETGEIIDVAPAAASPPSAAAPPRDEPVPVSEPPASAVSPPDKSSTPETIAKAEDLAALFEQHSVPEPSRRMALLQFGKREVGELTPEEATAVRQQILARYATA